MTDLPDTRRFSPSSDREGHVEDIGEGEFTVRLVNAKSPSSLPGELATFSKSELSQDERNLLVPDAIVRWVVGVGRPSADQRRRVSRLQFRKLPLHSIHDFEHAGQGVSWTPSPGMKARETAGPPQILVGGQVTTHMLRPECMRLALPLYPELVAQAHSIVGSHDQIQPLSP